MNLATLVVRKTKIHIILLNSLLGLAILWGPTASADPIDGIADFVFGQPNFTSNTINNGGVSASSLFTPYDVALDSAGNVYVADRNNHRVLVYLDPRNTDLVADLVLGQPDFVSNIANNGGLSASGLSNPSGVAMDAAGNVYVADQLNNRVLVYFDLLNTDTVADVVLGQPDFTSNTINNGGLSASSLFRPYGIAVDTADNVYVAEQSNNRVLIYLDLLNTDTVADVVLGQPDFFSNTPNNGGLSASSLLNPRGVMVDAAGNVYVADSPNNRVLEYHTPLTTDTVADVVFGQPDFFSNSENFGGVSASSLFNPLGVAVDADSNIYVTDSGNSRVLEYHTPLTTDTVADVVLGQPGLTAAGANNGGLSASSLFNPRGVAVDAAGNVYVADTTNIRVLGYDGVLAVTTTLTCAGFDAPFVTPLALAQKSNKPIPLQIALSDSNGGVITDTDISSPPIVDAHIVKE